MVADPLSFMGSGSPFAKDGGIARGQPGSLIDPVDAADGGSGGRDRRRSIPGARTSSRPRRGHDRLPTARRPAAPATPIAPARRAATWPFGSPTFRIGQSSSHFIRTRSPPLSRCSESSGGVAAGQHLGATPEVPADPADALETGTPLAPAALAHPASSRAAARIRSGPGSSTTSTGPGASTTNPLGLNLGPGPADPDLGDTDAWKRERSSLGRRVSRRVGDARPTEGRAARGIGSSLLDPEPLPDGANCRRSGRARWGHGVAWCR